MLLSALSIINMGIIRAVGGNGADAAGITNVGGGGGGGGGAILLSSFWYEGPDPVVTGGTGGAKIGGTGVAGSAGGAGVLIKYTMNAEPMENMG